MRSLFLVMVLLLVHAPAWAEVRHLRLGGEWVSSTGAILYLSSGQDGILQGEVTVGKTALGTFTVKWLRPDAYQFSYPWRGETIYGRYDPDTDTAQVWNADQTFKSSWRRPKR